MKSRKRLGLGLLVAVVCAIMIWFLLAFTGVLDSGKFEIVQSEIVLPNHVAMLARRSDNTALGGDTYFVVIDNHLYSARELRRALHSSRPVFIAGRVGVHIHATAPNVLTIECKDCGITKNLFEKQRFSDGGSVIQYVGFP